MDLLVNRGTYRTLTSDHTNKHKKNRLVNLFRTIKAEGGLGDTLKKDFTKLV